MNWINSSGNRRLYCFDTGKGKPVILLHGAANTSCLWEQQVSRLVKFDYRVIVPDLAGHGASDPLPKNSGIPGLVTDLWAVCDSLSLEKMHLVGLSLGGMITLAAALDQPERFESITIANSSAANDSDEVRGMITKWSETLRSQDGALRWFQESWSQGLSKFFRKSSQGFRTHQIWQGIAAKENGNFIADVLESIVGFNCEPQLKSIKLPTLLIAGGDDPMSILTKSMTQKIENSQVVELKGAKHLCNVDSADAFTNALQDFFEQHH